MEGPQKIHPVHDIEAPPPLIPCGPVSSEQASGSHPLQQNRNHSPVKGGPGPGPGPSHPLWQEYRNHSPQRTIHQAIPPNKRKGNLCCRCICWTVSLLFILLMIIGATCGILYLVFQPKLPKYSIDSMTISDLRLDLDTTVHAKFNVKATATNPNEKIGIYYEKGSNLSIWFRSAKLCDGSLPIFYQGHKNVAKLDLVMTGEGQYGSDLISALQDQQQTGKVPLELKINAPVAIKLGKLKLKKVRISGKCILVVDKLSSNKLVTIKASNCGFGLKL